LEFEMSEPLRLLCVLAHPDDETLGVGASLAYYAAQGIEIHLLTATRGERGWFGPEEENPGPEALGKIRETELLCASETLGIRRVDFLDYIDGDLDQADPPKAINRIAAHIRAVRPQVVVTFGPDGVYGHPDHIAISQFTPAAVMQAASAGYRDPQDLPPHQVSKLYYFVIDQKLADVYSQMFADLTMTIDGVERRPVVWPDWAITTIVDGGDVWHKVLKAVRCHKSQIKGYGDLSRLTDEQNHLVWGRVCFYRVFSLVNGSRKREDDLFTGLR
jgi:LmbE family N-acetylglucosaminyl deacetylase